VHIDAAPIEALFLMVHTAFAHGGRLTTPAPDHLVDIRREPGHGIVRLVVYPSVRLREWADPILEGSSL
jgi:hypothetical protein